MCDNEKSYTLTDEYIKANKNKILNNINSGINLFNETLSKIKQHKIEKIYAWNGRRASDGPVVYAAEYRNLPFKSFVSQEPKRYTLSRGTKIHDLKYIKRRINNFIKYISKKNINFEKSYRNYILNKITGLAGFGNYGYENFIKKNNLIKTNEKNFVIFFTSSSYENAGFSDWDSRIYLDQYQALEKIIKDQRLKNLKIFIRWHPLLKKQV